MTQWQPGMRITDVRLNDYTPVALTSTPTAAASFAVSSFSGRKSGGTVEWAVQLTYSGSSLTADNTSGTNPGNLADTLCCTLPADCRPGVETYVMFEAAGTKAGSVRIMPDGTCLLTTMYPNAVLGANTVKFGASFQTG